MYIYVSRFCVYIYIQEREREGERSACVYIYMHTRKHVEAKTAANIMLRHVRGIQYYSYHRNMVSLWWHSLQSHGNLQKESCPTHLFLRKATVGARKLEHDSPPNPNQRRKQKTSKHHPTFHVPTSRTPVLTVTTHTHILPDGPSSLFENHQGTKSSTCFKTIR